MAKVRDPPGEDAGIDGGVEGGERSKKSTKKRKKKGKDGKRPRFCPNSSKSMNQSRTFHHQRQVSVSALKKNNEELARTLNIHKSVIAELKADKIQLERDMQEMRDELVHLRADRDPVLVEAEVQRRLADVLGPVKGAMDRAIDNMVGLSDNLTQGVRLVNNTLRQSSAPRSTGGSRSSSIGPSIQMRPVAGTSRTLPSSNSPSKGPVSKVTPMVAGHAISRPRIQLTKMDNDAMSAAMDRQQLRPPTDQSEESGPDDELEEVPNDVVEEEVDMNTTVSSSPPVDLGRNRFNLTNIGEESTLDESRIVENIVEDNEVEMSTILTPVEESNELNSPEDVPIRRRVSSVMNNRTSTGVRPSRSSGIEADIIISPQVDSTRSQRRSTRSPVADISLRSPQVDLLRTQRHPSVVLSPLTIGDTPVLPTPSPVRPSFDDFPENPTESFLESLAEDDGEGPSWLFDSKKDKKRRSAARKLSSVWSEDEGRGTTSSGRGGTSSGLDSSDLSLTRNDTTGEDDSEVSGYILSEDLLDNPTEFEGKTRSPSLANLKLALSISPTGGGLPSSADTTFSDDMEMTAAVINKSDQENIPTNSIIDEDIEITISSDTSRTPLREMSSEGGQVVKYNPKLDTGVTVAGLKKAHIQLNNVGLKRLSDCYINISPGRSLSLDQVFNLGLQAGISSPRLSGSLRGKRSVTRNSGRKSSSAVALTPSTEASTSVMSSCKDLQLSSSKMKNRAFNENTSADSSISSTAEGTSAEKTDFTEVTVESAVEINTAVGEEIIQVNKEVNQGTVDSLNNEGKEDTVGMDADKSDQNMNINSRTSRANLSRNSKSSSQDINTATKKSTCDFVNNDSSEETDELAGNKRNEEMISASNDIVTTNSDQSDQLDQKRSLSRTSSRANLSRNSKSPSQDINTATKKSTCDVVSNDSSEETDDSAGNKRNDEIINKSNDIGTTNSDQFDQKKSIGSRTSSRANLSRHSKSPGQDIHPEASKLTRALENSDSSDKRNDELITESNGKSIGLQEVSDEDYMKNDNAEASEGNPAEPVDSSKDSSMPRTSRVRSSVNYAAYLSTPEADKDTSKKGKSRLSTRKSVVETSSIARTSVLEKPSKPEDKSKHTDSIVSKKTAKSEHINKTQSKLNNVEKKSKSDEKVKAVAKTSNVGKSSNPKKESSSMSEPVTDNADNGTRGGRRRAASGSVSYAERPLNKKMRRS